MGILHSEINLNQNQTLMNRLFILFLVLLTVIMTTGTANCQRMGKSVNDDFNVHQWVDRNFAKGVIPPFSFNYGGKNSKTFITHWDYRSEIKKTIDPNVVEYVYTYSDRQSGLTVRCFVSCFKDFPAVEWVLKFTNSSDRNSPLLTRAKAIDYLFVSDKTGTFTLYHAKGSDAQRTDFQPLRDEMQIGESVYMTPAGGRSSDNTAFPFFNIETPGNCGIMVAIGWSGKWYADVQKTNENSLLLVSGMEKMELTLLPGEEIRSPKICLLFWHGEDRMAGHNQFRQFILAHHTRQINGKNAELPFASGLGFGGPAPCNEYSCATESYAIAMAYRHKQFNLVPEVFWIDAGWYTGCGGWWDNVGNWTVNKVNFPNGLKPVTDVVHKLGAKFILWLEPERVYKRTQLIKEHPGYLTTFSDTIKYQSSLFNLGNTEARLWLTDYISNLIKSEGIDYYRQDFNFDPLPYWEFMDKPQRIGISEIKHIEGLYSFWDSLLARFPDIVIDNCASGGRRIDLETVSRSSPLWRTDYQPCEPNGYQCHTYGLNFYLPLHGTGNTTPASYEFRSSMSSAMVIVWDINNSNFPGQQALKDIQDFKRLRPYFYEDYYPLTDYRTGDDSWMAYQLNRLKQNDGVVFAFRRPDCQNKSITIKMHGLDMNTTYELYYEDYGIKFTMTGAEIMRGIDISIPTSPGSLLISYKKL
jgi:alpha-galactosidase